jgi:N-carbamoyl-L-amino-acid hydrolase
MLVDQRHLDAGELAAMLAEARRAADEACAAEGVTVTWDRIVSIAPRPFDDRLISIAREVCRDLCGHDRLLPSGPLHDATEMAARVPTAMVFSSSTSGLSHNRAEDTPEEHLKLATTAFHRTVRRALVALT